ncbi:hypothetical protein C8J57DRAFT_1069253, partial [Mycena rebaudengoi]
AHAGTEVEEVIRAFQAVDKSDGDENIGAEELRYVLTQLRMKSNDAEVDEPFTHARTDTKSNVKYDSFL